ncbi:MAG: ribosomal protein S18-alanine N-acetyltransferase [Oscillospiraceae bacterium]|jgi:ribosomal-protein-alanine N-acetyltransferase|nr:ribosomal protein S18-alanine N-acetyltransferase [Oscillospiraceae bacterium]
MIQISDALPEHVDGIAAIERECFSDPWDRETIARQLSGPNHLFLTAMDGPRVAGYVGLMHVLDEGYISNVAVSAGYRRQSVGDRLIDALVARGRDLRLSFLTLEVRRSNDPATALYAKHGFVPVGVRKNYYVKPKEDAILMTLYLKEETK